MKPEPTIGRDPAATATPAAEPVLCNLCSARPATFRGTSNAGPLERERRIETCMTCRTAADRTTAIIFGATASISWAPLDNAPTSEATGPGAIGESDAPPTPPTPSVSHGMRERITHEMRALERDLAVIDTEWIAGWGRNREMIALAVERLHPDGTGFRAAWTFKPMRPVDDETRRIHGFTDEILAGAPPFTEKAEEVLDAIAGADIGGYGVTNDVTLLEHAFHAAGVKWPTEPIRIIDGLRIWQSREGRKLSDAYERFGDQTALEEGNPHEADTDARMTTAVLEALVGGLSAADIETTTDPGRMDPAGKFRRDDAGQVVLAFGEHRGRPALEHTNFLFWMLNRNFPRSTQEVIEELLAQNQAAADGAAATNSKKLDPEGRLATTAGVVYFTFGRHKGKPCRDHPDYLEWIIRSTDKFSAATIAAARTILDKQRTGNSASATVGLQTDDTKKADAEKNPTIPF